MALGEFTKEEVAETLLAVSELYAGLTPAKRGEFALHYGNVLEFLKAANLVAPEGEPNGIDGASSTNGSDPTSTPTASA